MLILIKKICTFKLLSPPHNWLLLIPNNSSDSKQESETKALEKKDNFYFYF